MLKRDKDLAPAEGCPHRFCHFLMLLQQMTLTDVPLLHLGAKIEMHQHQAGGKESSSRG